MLLLLILVGCFLIGVCKLSNAHLPDRPVLAIQLPSSGMHRDLIYTVQFDYPLAGSECEYLLEQDFPAGIYINTDQFADLQRLRKLNALYPSFVDVELPAEKSQKFKVLLRGQPKINDTLSLPIHLRYHAPQLDNQFVAFEIAAPMLYLQCPSTDVPFIEADMQVAPGKTYCLDSENLKLIPVTPLSTNNCQWHLINAKLQEQSSLTIAMPVGNAHAFRIVLYVTIILSWLVSLCMAYYTHAVPQRINQKLHEQRLLQNKVK